MQPKRSVRSSLYSVSGKGTRLKALGKIIRLCVRLSLLAFVGFVGYKLVGLYPALKEYSTTLSTPSAVTCHQESIFNSEVRAFIMTKLDQLLTGSTFYKLNPTVLEQELAPAGSVVMSCAYSIDKSGGMTVTVRGVEPLFLINGQQVLGSNRQLHDAELFEQYPLETVHHIKVARNYCNDQLDDGVYQFLQKIPIERLKNYTINYKEPHCVHVRPQDTEKKYCIKADEQSFFDDRKVAAAGELYEQLKGQSITRRQKEKLWVFDIRFDKRIFIRSGREGEGDE